MDQPYLFYSRETSESPDLNFIYSSLGICTIAHRILTMNPSIIDSVSPAWSRMITALFRPFHLEKWFCLGFGAWLMTLAETISSAGSNIIDMPFARLTDWTDFTVMLMGGIAFFALLLMILFAWLSARGRFIFLYQVINNNSSIQKPWTDYREVAHSFFFWSLGLYLAVFLLVLVPLAGALYFFYPFFEGDSITGSAQVLGGACAALAILLLIPSLYAGFYLQELIAPIMFRYQCRAEDAWRFFLPALKQHTASLLLFPFFWAVLAAGFFFATLILGLLTCCCGFLLLMIPYLGSVVTLPIPFFLTSYSLEYLKSIGQEYDPFTMTATPPAAPEQRL
jgi:hypothetical protein